MNFDRTCPWCTDWNFDCRMVNLNQVLIGISWSEFQVKVQSPTGIMAQQICNRVDLACRKTDGFRKPSDALGTSPTKVKIFDQLGLVFFSRLRSMLTSYSGWTVTSANFNAFLSILFPYLRLFAQGDKPFQHFLIFHSNDMTRKL